MERSRIYKSNGRYWFTYRKDGKRQQKRIPKPITTQRRAEIWADDWLAGVGSGNTLCLSDYARGFYAPGCSWASRKGISEPWRKMREYWLNDYLLPEWGDYQVADLNPIEIESWLLNLDFSGKTRNGIRETLTIITHEARRERVIPFNPLTEIERLPEDARERSPFTPEEAEALFPDDLSKVWAEPYGLASYLMYCTGMRSGEVRALGASGVRKGGVLIVRAVKARGGLGPTKNTDERASLLTDRAAEYLKDYRMPGNLLFPGRGTYMRVRTLGSHLEAAIQKAGIETRDRWLTPHSLRHTWRTEMKRLELAGGIDKGSVDYMMGHRSEGVAARYIHLKPEEALDVLEQYRPRVTAALV